MNAEGGCICARFAVVTEAAALGAADWIGRGDGLAGELAARTAMADALAEMPIKVKVVASRGSGRGPAVLQPGDELGGRLGRTARRRGAGSDGLGRGGPAPRGSERPGPRSGGGAGHDRGRAPREA